MRGLRVVFVPRYRGNPYLTQLDEHLSARGVKVAKFGRSVIPTLTGLARRRPDVLHLHWLDAFFAASSVPVALGKLALFIGGVLVLKLLGSRIVWTAHNLEDHEKRNPNLDRFCTRFVIRRADAIIAHCNAAKRTLVSEFSLGSPDKVFVIPHGHYCEAYENGIRQSEARRALGIDEQRCVFLLLGQIRQYKGVLDLIEDFAVLGRDDVELVIAGNVRSDELSEVIRRRVARHRHITYKPGFVADEQIQVYMNASDAVVFPYRDILTSGAVVLAMSFSRACIAPRIGCIEEVLDEAGAFLYDAKDENGLLNAMRRAIGRRADLSAMGEHNRRLTAPWGWDRIAGLTLDVYEQCVRRSTAVTSGAEPR